MARKTRMTREKLPPGEHLCSYCTAKCCRYFALPIDTPTVWDDFDNMRWYIMHGRTSIFIDGGTWYLLVYGDCKNLLPDNRCCVYEKSNAKNPQLFPYSTDLKRFFELRFSGGVAGVKRPRLPPVHSTLIVSDER